MTDTAEMWRNAALAGSQYLQCGQKQDLTGHGHGVHNSALLFCYLLPVVIIIIISRQLTTAVVDPLSRQRHRMMVYDAIQAPLMLAPAY
jgi:hypothetical protein